MDLPERNGRVGANYIWSFSFSSPKSWTKRPKRNARSRISPSVGNARSGLSPSVGRRQGFVYHYFQDLMQSNIDFTVMSCKQKVTDIYTSRSPSLFTFFPCTPKGSEKKTKKHRRFKKGTQFFLNIQKNLRKRLTLIDCNNLRVAQDSISLLVHRCYITSNQ
jgi:hypothetical protein